MSREMSERMRGVSEAEAWYGERGQSPNRQSGPVEEGVLQLVTRFVIDRQATCTRNPLLWWVGILVKSSLQAGADDYISRGRFNVNILPMDLDIRARLQGILHYSKVLILDHKMHKWEATKSRLMNVAGEK